jgi:hypothetical protein
MGGKSKPKPKPKPTPPPPPQAKPIDYGKVIQQSSKASQESFEKQLAAQIKAYPKQEALQLGTLAKVSGNLNNSYTRDANSALQAAAKETIKLTQSGDRIGSTANRSNQIASAAQKFAAAPTSLDRQISRLGASAMSQQADQVKGQKIAKTGNMQAAKVQPVRNVKADKVRAATAKGAQVANVKDVQAATGNAAQMGQVADVGTRDIRANAAERALMNEARGGGLLGQLESQASNDLALGRSLSAEQERDAIQSARAGAAARGMATGNSAMAAELLNRDRYATQREAERRAFASGVLNQGTGIRQVANQATLTRQEGNAVRNLQADLANQSTDFNTGQFNAGNQQQMALANMANSQQANLANFDFDTNRAMTNAQMMQQSQQFNAANQQQASLANQQTGLSAALANQQTGLQIGLTDASFRQAANAANFDAANNRAFTEAGYRQQASLANQDANQRQVEMNRAFLQNANQSGINSQISRGGYAMGALGQTANLYGQQAGAYQNAAGLGINIANQSMANDPYMRAFAPGTSIGGSTLGTSANMIGNTWSGATQMAGNVASFNANMLDSRYNSYQNNQAALQGAQMQAGATAGASQNAMMGSGMAAGGMVLGMTALAI